MGDLAQICAELNRKGAGNGAGKGIALYGAFRLTAEFQSLFFREVRAADAGPASPRMAAVWHNDFHLAVSGAPVFSLLAFRGAWGELRIVGQ